MNFPRLLFLPSVLVCLVAFSISCTVWPFQPESEPAEPELYFQISTQYAHPGREYPLYIKQDSASRPLESFDFLISFDESEGILVDVEPGPDLQQCSPWEIKFEKWEDPPCADTCSHVYYRIYGSATSPEALEGCELDGSALRLVTLNFILSDDFGQGRQEVFFPVRFAWVSCDNNVVTLHDAKEYYALLSVSEADGRASASAKWEMIDSEGLARACGSVMNERPLRRALSFRHGYFWLPESQLQGSGDVNLNGIGFEIADAVLYSQYFVNGISAFGESAFASLLASDVNEDGLYGTLEDFVWMTRVIVGDALPLTHLPPPESDTMYIRIRRSENALTIENRGTEDAGAALFIFSISPGTEISTPQLRANALEMDIKYSESYDQYRILIYNIGSYRITADPGELFAFGFLNGVVSPVEARFATYDGVRMKTIVEE